MKKQEKQFNNSIVLVALGDIMLTRSIGQFIDENGSNEFFKYVREPITNADIAFANLETTLTTRGKPISKNDPNVTFRSHPKNANILKELGIDIVSLANNHIFDYGAIGLQDTLDFLDCNSIKHVGAGLCEEDANQYSILDKNGIKVGFLAFHQLLGPAVRAARKNKPGVAQLLLGKACRKIKSLKKLTDVVVTSIHWGMDYHQYPSPYDIELAHKLIESGSDLILGHHPHVLQGYEKYKNSHIFYSLGNFVFDDPNPLTHYSVMLEIHIGHNGLESFEFIPIVTNENYQPKISFENENAIVSMIEQLSQEYKSKLWIGNIDKDPTDKLMLKAIKNAFKRGNFSAIANYPPHIYIKRAIPLLSKKVKHYLLQSLKQNI